jgi:hypothetical protein
MYPIASFNTNSGAAPAFDFTNIPQTFTHLQLRVFGQSTLSASTDNLSMYFNNDTANNYVTHAVSGSGATAGSTAFTAQPRFYVPSLFPAATSAQFAAIIIDVLDYTSVVKNKTVRIIGGFDANGSGNSFLTSGLWLSTAAITRFSGGTSANFAQYSRFDLYGISNSTMAGV